MPKSESNQELPENFIPDADDPRREWTDLGGDLEASYDGARYVDFRVKGSHQRRLFISKGALEKALALFDPEPVAP